MCTNNSVGICGIGHYLPDHVMTNQAFVDRGMDTTPEWIETRTGIQTRHIASKDERTSDMATAAAKQAISSSNVSTDQIDFIIVATATPDHNGFPSTACLVQQKLGIQRSIPCFDLTAACSGFAYAIAVANGYIATGIGTYGLVIGAEKLSSLVDWSDRRTAILFGDGAGAAVIGPVTSGGILGMNQGANGHASDILKCDLQSNVEGFDGQRIPGNCATIHMDGQAVFKTGVTVVLDSLRSLAQNHDIDLTTVDYFVCHQANSRILDTVAKKLALDSSKFLMNISRVGNTSAASIPLVLSEYKQQFKPGDKVCLVGFGAGFTWSSILLEWSYNYE
ncbi:MAG: beta-ketoacyl-ACP synthase III [Candidatus Marinamargulisbacteria bacterium]